MKSLKNSKNSKKTKKVKKGKQTMRGGEGVPGVHSVPSGSVHSVPSGSVHSVPSGSVPDVPSGSVPSGPSIPRSRRGSNGRIGHGVPPSSAERKKLREAVSKVSAVSRVRIKGPPLTRLPTSFSGFSGLTRLKIGT